MSAPLQKSASAATAPSGTMAWLIEHAPVSKGALQATATATDVDALLTQLFDAGHIADALRLVATALPPRQGIWWAWAAATHGVRLAGEGPVKPAVTEALAAAERWITTPDDEARRAAWAASERAGLDTPAGCVAAAPFFAAGSIAPPDVAFIPPPPGIYTTMVATAVFLSAMADEAHVDAMAKAFAAQGLEVVKQLGGWDQSVQAARAHIDGQREAQRKATAPAAKAPPSQSAQPSA